LGKWRDFSPARTMDGNPAILGYEPFNEPHPVGLSKKSFEENTLTTYYHQVEREISKYDPTALIFIEPRMDSTTYPADGPEFNGFHFNFKSIVLFTRTICLIIWKRHSIFLSLL
jgi:hypothetical protein